MANTEVAIKTDKQPVIKRARNALVKDFKKYKYIYLMLLPVVAYYLLFHYGPLFGLQIAFKRFSPGKGIWGSPWVGLQHFIYFVKGIYFWKLIRNTVLLNFYNLIFGFPAPIIFALMLNEVRNNTFKRGIQTITYMPHFVSTVVIVGILFDFFSRDGLVNNLLGLLGIESVPFLIKPEWFRTLYIGSDIWQSLGWGSIIYLAAIVGIDQELYEASKVDGCSKLRQIWHITIPGIMPTIVILLILRIGRMMSVGYDKIILMYNPLTMDTADVISTHVYRRGLLEMSYDYSTAVGLFNSVINFALLLLANRFSRAVGESSLW